MSFSLPPSGRGKKLGPDGPREKNYLLSHLTVVPALPLGRVPVLPHSSSPQMVLAPPPVERLPGMPLARPRLPLFKPRAVFEVFLPFVAPLVEGAEADVALGPLVRVLDAAGGGRGGGVLKEKKERKERE